MKKKGYKTILEWTPVSLDRKPHGLVIYRLAASQHTMTRSQLAKGGDGLIVG